MQEMMQRRQTDSMIAEALKHVNVKRVKKLAKCDGDFKAVLDLVDACKKSFAHKNKKMSWSAAARMLYKKIMFHDPLHINFVDKKREDGTWCLWLTWDAPTAIGTMSGYSLVASGFYGDDGDETTHENAAKSFITDFCRVGPVCLEIYNDPLTRERQRHANTAIVTVYKELSCPKTPEEVMDKLALA